MWKLNIQIALIDEAWKVYFIAILLFFSVVVLLLPRILLFRVRETRSTATKWYTCIVSPIHAVVTIVAWEVDEICSTCSRGEWYFVDSQCHILTHPLTLSLGYLCKYIENISSVQCTIDRKL